MISAKDSPELQEAPAAGDRIKAASEPLPEQSAPRPKRRRRPKNPDKKLVFIERARCPACESTDLHTRKSMANGDGTLTRDARCRGCDLLFLIVVE